MAKKRTKKRVVKAWQPNPAHDQIRNTALMYALQQTARGLRHQSQNEVIQCAIRFERFLLGRYDD